MSAVNASTGYSNFQIRFGRSPRVLPPMVDAAPRATAGAAETAEQAADRVIRQLTEDVADARDCLIAAKVHQAAFANRSRGEEVPYAVGDKVMLSTLNRRRQYKATGEHRAAK
ncbi:uncharacterized protein C8Q71DRAFT_695691, partial [Rhodofomes roseus]